MIGAVCCEPQPDSNEQEVDIDFKWMNKTVSDNVKWNATRNLEAIEEHARIIAKTQ
jgi:hypothetical protein